MNKKQAIGVFDSGYGGLTVLKEIVKLLPDYDYIYLGDNARSPYGPRSFETVYKYTLEAVKYLFDCDCPLVIIACNTSSAKALRNIQQKDLNHIDPTLRVLGVIRPLTESVDKYTHSKHVGVFGTVGTVTSGSYQIEINKFFPDIKVTQQACPMWVPLVENNEHHSDGADFFVKKYIDEILRNDPKIDTIILGCTHYPLLLDKIRKYLACKYSIISQGEIVSVSLVNYLLRHRDMEARLTKGCSIKYYTTDNAEKFNQMAGIFMGHEVQSEKVSIA